MDLKLLSSIDDDLAPSEVAALCFLCLDVVKRKTLEKIRDARELFSKLEEKCLMGNSSFLSQLLQTIRREDLVRRLKADSRQLEETDATPLLSEYRVLLYNIYDELGSEGLKKMKFLLRDKLGGRPTEMCETALDVFAEMEKKDLLSNRNLDELHEVLKEVNQQLASNVQQFKQQFRDQGICILNKHVMPG